MQTYPETLPQDCMNDMGNTTYENGLLEEDENRHNEVMVQDSDFKTEFKIVCTLAQLFILRTFYRTTLNDGTDVFIPPWLETLGFDYHFARFYNPPVANRNGSKWIVTLPLEICPKSDAPDDIGVYWDQKIEAAEVAEALAAAIVAEGESIAFIETFTGADGTYANEEFWDTQIASGANVLDILNNQLHMSGSVGSSGTAQYSFVNSLFYLEGDFDVQCDFSFYSTNSATSLETAMEARRGPEPGYESYYYRVLYNRYMIGCRGLSGNIDTLESNINSSNINDLETSSEISSVGGCKLRIVRENGIISTYYRESDESGEWRFNSDLDGHVFDSYPYSNPMSIRFTVTLPKSSNSLYSIFDNFIINSGTLTMDSAAALFLFYGATGATFISDFFGSSGNMDLVYSDNNVLGYDGGSDSQTISTTLSSLFGMGGDIEIVVTINISDYTDPSTGNETQYSLKIYNYQDESQFCKITLVRSDVDVLFRASATGETDEEVSVTSPSVLKLKIKRVDGVCSFLYWNASLSQFEWDGDTDGFTFGTGNNAILATNLFFQIGQEGSETFEISSLFINVAESLLDYSGYALKYLFQGEDGDALDGTFWSNPYTDYYSSGTLEIQSNEAFFELVPLSSSDSGSGSSSGSGSGSTSGSGSGSGSDVNYYDNYLVDTEFTVSGNFQIQVNVSEYNFSVDGYPAFFMKIMDEVSGNYVTLSATNDDSNDILRYYVNVSNYTYTGSVIRSETAFGFRVTRNGIEWTLSVVDGTSDDDLEDLFSLSIIGKNEVSITLGLETDGTDAISVNINNFSISDDATINYGSGSGS